jgi:hypothetical protein
MAFFGLGGLFYGKHPRPHPQATANTPRSCRAPHQCHSNPLRRPLPRTQYVRTSPSSIPRVWRPHPHHLCPSRTAHRILQPQLHLANFRDSRVDRQRRARFWRPARRCECKGAADKPCVVGTHTHEKYVSPHSTPAVVAACRNPHASRYVPLLHKDTR